MWLAFHVAGHMIYHFRFWILDWRCKRSALSYPPSVCALRHVLGVSIILLKLGIRMMMREHAES
jgi:hypothetical protein